MINQFGTNIGSNPIFQNITDQVSQLVEEALSKSVNCESSNLSLVTNIILRKYNEYQRYSQGW